MLEQINVGLIDYLKKVIYRERPDHIRRAVAYFKENYPELNHPSILAAFILDFDHECERIYPFSDEIYIDAKVKYATAVFFTCISIAIALYCANNLPLENYYSLPSLLFSTSAVFLLSLFYITPMEHHARIRGGMKSRMTALSKDRNVHKFLEGKLKYEPIEEEKNTELNAVHLGARKYRAKPTYLEILRHLTPSSGEPPTPDYSLQLEVPSDYQDVYYELKEAHITEVIKRETPDTEVANRQTPNIEVANSQTLDTEVDEEMIVFGEDRATAITIQPSTENQNDATDAIDATEERTASSRCNIL